MSSIVFDSFKGFYHSYYQIGIDWTSPNHSMPQRGYMCDLKMQRDEDDPIIEMGYFSIEGWKYWSGGEIKDYGNIIEWKYIPMAKRSCEIL